METNFLSSPTEESPALSENAQFRKAVGSLLYLATVSRPDIAFAVGQLCRRVESPTQSDWKAVKRVIRYLAGSVSQKLRFSSEGNIKLTGFVDADWAGDHADRKSTSALQWLRQLLADMEVPQDGPTKIYEDNQGCIKVAQSDRCSQRTKHIDVRHHQLRDLCESGIVSLVYCPSSEMPADVLTKPLGKDKFDRYLKLLGLQ
ncbi:hypothetical protein M514_23769 [Trichuris suis]|uniref:Reverse transcriptase Ty1/copia-type domain-containing protein n=1 Tax=Trichuris suis TaxID=68888 RepID=A0A085N3L3_9BILA|nr:hypothetical protein M514_23769 [Trichuris suis]